MRTEIVNGYDPINMNANTKDFFKMRKRLFVDEMGWDIPHDHEIENDQYDHLGTTYVIILDQEKVVAGARILATNQTHGNWSYMIKDAIEGKIAEIPKNLMETAPVNLGVFEITRFTVDPALCKDYRQKALQELAMSSYETVAKMGGYYALAMMSPFFVRWFNSIGIAVNRLGPIVKGEREHYCVIGGEVNAASSNQRVA